MHFQRNLYAPSTTDICHVHPDWLFDVSSTFSTGYFIPVILEAGVVYQVLILNLHGYSTCCRLAMQAYHFFKDPKKPWLRSKRGLVTLKQWIIPLLQETTEMFH
mmetsp:Transcript_7018/g.24922  ORF Transcript_7018/g.24922 Transcript_7018/m.24922 type:complete len:104 (-) Transcript_7018:187-498(-)